MITTAHDEDAAPRSAPTVGSTMDRTTIAVIAGVVPLVAYVATASGHSYWLDSGELVAASVDLGIAHPPGEPLAALLHHAAIHVPIGAIPFRVALVSALAAAAAIGVLFLAALRTLVALGVPEHPLGRVLALGASWVVAASQGYWLQAIRPEVYAIEAFLVFLCIERILAVEEAVPEVRVRPIYAASLAFGLAIANHHFLALLLLPAAAPTLARIVARRGSRPLGIAVALAFLGAATFVYLPIRAADFPLLDLGHPTSFERFRWVVSAEAFQKNQGAGVPDPLGDRMMEVVVQLATSLSPVTIFVALAGIYVLLRANESRRLGVLWALLLGVEVFARAWLGFLRDNPDALGYLMPAFAAIATLAVAFVGVLLALLGDRFPKLAVALGALVPLGAGASLVLHANDASLATFVATDVVDDVTFRDVPPRAAILAFDPQTVFRGWEIAAVEAARPDLSLVPVPFLGYPELANRIVENDRSLEAIVRDDLLEGSLDAGSLESLAAERPVLVELDVRVDPSLYASLAPSGFYHRVLPGGSTDTDVDAGAAEEAALFAALEGRLRGATDPETKRRRLWRRYQQALFLAGRGAVPAARAAVRAARSLAPEDGALRRLDDALEGADGPIDVRPFRVGPEG